MSRIRLAIAGSVRDLNHADQRTLLNRAAEFNIEVIFLTDHTIASLVGNQPVVFWTGPNGQLSTTNGIDVLMENLEMLVKENRLDDTDRQDIHKFFECEPEAELVEEDNYRKVPHLERGGFLGRRKRGGNNYRHQ